MKSYIYVLTWVYKVIWMPHAQYVNCIMTFYKNTTYEFRCSLVVNNWTWIFLYFSKKCIRQEVIDMHPDLTSYLQIWDLTSTSSPLQSRFICIRTAVATSILRFTIHFLQSIKTLQLFNYFSELINDHPTTTVNYSDSPHPRWTLQGVTLRGIFIQACLNHFTFPQEMNYYYLIVYFTCIKHTLLMLFITFNVCS